MWSLILMIFLNISPLHSSMFFFLFHLSSLIILDFIFFVPFHPTVFFYIFLDILLDQFCPCWPPEFFCCCYIYSCLFSDWMNSAVKGLLKIVFALLSDYNFCYTFFFTVYYTMIYHHCTVLQILLSRSYPCLNQYFCSWYWYWDLQ